MHTILLLCVLEFEEAEMKKVLGNEPLLPKLSQTERNNIMHLIQFNKDKLLV